MTRFHSPLDRRHMVLGIAAIGAGVIRPPNARAAEPIRIAAAADLQVVLPELVAAFSRVSGTSAKITYGASGNLARQIRQGAPFEVFLSADERFVHDLVRDGVLPAAGPVYARGRLAIIARRDQAFHRSLLAADPLEEVATLARTGSAFRVAIANPEHAPYGQRAIEVLRARDLLDLFRPRLVFGENVAQATQYVASGAAAIGLVSHSIARAPAMVDTVVAAALSPDLHSPLDQRLAVSAKASPAAIAFAEFLMTREAQSLFSSHDFDPPGQSR